MPADSWLSHLHDNPLPWLLSSNPWTELNTRIDLLGEQPDSPAVQSARKALMQHVMVRELLDQHGHWFPESVTRHNKGSLSHYTLSMMLQLGLTATHPGLNKMLEQARLHTEDGLFAIRQTLPVRGEGPGQADLNANEWHAMPCDSPLLTHALLLAHGMQDDIRTAVQRIDSHWREPAGWFCHFFFVQGQYKKLNLGCPMAGLQALQLFADAKDEVSDTAVREAFQSLEAHRDSGKSLYFFGRSKKFWTFKYPFVWYNALYLADVLSRHAVLMETELFQELIRWILVHQDEIGRFRPTSMFMHLKEWDFSNKKAASPWMTLLCCRIIKRWHDAGLQEA